MLPSAPVWSNLKLVAQRWFLLAWLAGALVWVEGCKKPFLGPYGNNVFGVSRDTIRFDTLFTTLQSPSERFLIYNRSGRLLNVEEVYLENGSASIFKLILDGVEAQRHTGLELARNDSALAFLSLKTSVTSDKFIREYLIIKAGGATQRVPIEVQVLDAYFFRNRRLACNFTWPTDKPVVVDGVVQVDSNCTCVIPAGAKVYFTAARDRDFQVISRIQVYGTLRVEGAPGFPVEFRSVRLDPDYAEIAGQWYGIIFFSYSQGNLLRNVLIKNGTVGVRADSIAQGFLPKVEMDGVEIRNMSNFGILGLGASPQITGTPDALRVTNSLIHNCGQSSVGLFFGGNYSFINSTIANYGFDFTRRQPALAVQNFLEDAQGTIRTYSLNARFINTIIWGSERNEYGFEFRTGAPTTPSVTFTNCLIKYESPGQLSGTGNLFNQDPLFQNPRERDYRLVGDTVSRASPAINRGVSTSETPSIDIGGRTRDLPPDIGAWEYVND